MDIKEAINLANKSDPVTFRKTAAILQMIEKGAPDFMPDAMAEFQKIAEVADAKVASISPKGIALTFGAAALAGLGSALSTDLYDAAKRSLTKGSNYKRIMEANPELREIKDKGKMRMVYDSLHRYAPEFTADPLVGGSLLKNMTEAQDLSPSNIFNVIKARKELIDARNNQYKLPNVADKILKGNERNDSAGPPKAKTN